MEITSILDKLIINVRYNSIKLDQKDGIYKASMNGQTWYIPYRNKKQAKWCFDFMTDHERFVDTISTGDTILEAGAATGEYTVVAAEAVGSNGSIHCFEAEPQNNKCLRKNVEINGLTEQTTTHNTALSLPGKESLSVTVADSIAEHQIDDGRDRRSKQEYQNVVGSAADNQIMNVEVTATTVDDYCEKNHIQSIDMLKLTVNGHEASILKGASNMLSSTKNVLLNVEYTEAARILKDAGFVLEKEVEHDALGNPQLWVNTDTN